MPNSSSAFTRDASEKRGGGSVKCWSVWMAVSGMFWPSFISGSLRPSSSSLVQALEEFGIGRPSTYASIIQVLLFRDYVQLDNKRFRPSDVGRAVINFLTGQFMRYVDYDFTAKLEDELDAVSRGEED